MDNRLLLNNEQIITQSDSNIITLTNLRLRYSDTQWGRSHMISIMLEKISSIEMHYRSRIILIILAIIFVLGGFAAGIDHEPGLILLGIVMGALFFGLYLIFRRHFLTITSDGGEKIHFYIKGMTQEKVLNFINHLEVAIKQRREELK